MYRYRLVAMGYLTILFFIFLFVFARSEQSASPTSLVTATAIPTPTLTSTPTPSPTPIPVAMPARLVIPKLNIDVAIESRGEDTSGHMDVPSWDNAAWFNLGPRPTEEGSAVIAGHYDTNTGAPAIFYNLSSLSPGDEIWVINELNERHIFKVTDTRIYPYDLFPEDEVFNDPAGRKLNLITCSGTWNPAIHNYSDRLVVFAELQ